MPMRIQTPPWWTDGVPAVARGLSDLLAVLHLRRSAMMKIRLNPSANTKAAPANTAPAAGSLRLGKCLKQCLDRKLGYSGEDRFVLFHYEPRGQEVMWRDGRSYGFGHGGWQAFFDEVEPVARQHGISVGDDTRPADHVLVVDRVEGEAYFADRQRAQKLVTREVA